ncbi:LysR family transcriptional regulator, partial [Pseudomonas aeruginosa]|nr:LysR family transcriptional regulator [Pseudomonas aeruginosa]
PWVEQGRLRALLPATFGYQAPFSLILRRRPGRAAGVPGLRGPVGAPRSHH